MADAEAQTNGNGSHPSPALQRLTAEQRHYLLKSLVCAEMLDEWALLDEPNGLKQYGPPFINNGSPPPHKVGSQAEVYPEHTQKPLILMHLFHVHLRRFPGLKSANVAYWRQRILPFFDKIAQSTFSNCQERGELTNRKLLAFVATRYIATFWSRGVGVRGDGESKGPGKGASGSDTWGKGKQWGKGTVKRGLDVPVRPSEDEIASIQSLFDGQKYSADDQYIWKLAGSNVDRIKGDWSAWKESIIESEEGLRKTLEHLQVKSLNNLPPEYRNATEWVRRHVAFVLWTLFVEYPGGDDILAIIKTIHGLFPYWGAKQLLKIANAQKMIKAIIELLLARPAGMIDSLGQRIFFAVLNGEIGSINNNFLAPLKKAIQDKKICNALDNYVKNRTSEQRAKIDKIAREKNCDMVVSILEEFGYADMDKIRIWQVDFLHSEFYSHLDWAYPAASLKVKKMKTPPPANVQASASSGALQFAQIKLYLRERLRRRDREKVLEIGSGPLVPNIIKESLEIVFYSIIYEIALASDLSSRLGDLQRFVDDLIQVKKEKKDELEDWIALCARHENSLYIFVHEIRDAIRPIFDWCQEALDYMALSTSEPYNASNRKVTNVEIDLDDMILEAHEEDEVDVKAIFAELDGAVTYAKWCKVKQEVEMRKEYVQMRQDAVSNVTKVPKDGRQNVMLPSNALQRSIRESNNLMKKLMQEEGVAWDDGIVRSKSRGTDTGDLPWGFFGTNDLLHQHYSELDRKLRYTVEHIAPIPPSLTYTRTLLPTFRKRLQHVLPNWPARALC